MLSHDEDRSLKAIEQWFEESDPAFTRMLRDYEAPRQRGQRGAARIAVDLTGGLLFVVGAVATSAALMVFGVLMLAVGACMHLSAKG
jgi:hypothetical protein